MVVEEIRTAETATPPRRLTCARILIGAKPLGPIRKVTLSAALLAMSAVLTLWSMVVYLIAAWPHLRPDSDQNSSK